MTLQRGQILKRIDPFQFARVDETHEEVAHVCAVGRLEEVGVFAVQNRLLQGPFIEIVVKRRTWVAQKQRERPPVGEQVRDRLPEPRVRFDEVVGQLRGQPSVQILQQWPTVGLMVREARVRR